MRHIIVFAVIVLALYLLLPKLVDTQETVKYVSHASYVLLGAAIALEIAALAGYANLFRYVLRVLDIRMRLREVWAITLSGLAVSHILSAGGVGGWVVTYNALMKHKVPHGIIFVAIAAQQFFNYVVLWFFFALAMVYLIVVRGGDSIIGYLVGIILIVLILWLTSTGSTCTTGPPGCGAAPPRWHIWSTASGGARWSRNATSTAGSTTC